MTLTEEQREAIKYAISSLEQCGSEPEDPVVAKILGAMIDGSEHFSERTKMIGFDLEVRWHDDYMKRFSDITAWHCGYATLWIMHSSGKQEWIPLASVRRISSVEESP